MVSYFFFFSSRRRHTRFDCDWSSDVCSSDLEIAVAHRIYARALFDAAKEHDRLAGVREELGDFVAAIEEVPELRELLRNPQVDPRARAAALDDVLGDADELIRNFLRLLAAKGRSGQVGQTHEEFESL